MADFGIAVRGEENEAADVAEVLGAGDGERDEADLGVAGFGELRGLGDVLGNDQFAGDLVREVKAFEGFGGGETVGRVEAVGYGDLGDLGAGEGVEGEGLRGRILARPEDEFAAGVGDGLALGEVGGDELFWVDVVGGEEDVLRIAVAELLGEGGGGAEGGDDLDAGGVLVCCRERGEDRLEVGCGGYVEFLWSLRVKGYGTGAKEHHE